VVQKNTTRSDSSRVRPEIECVRSYGDIRIRINGVLHLCVPLKDFAGLQAWYEGDAKRIYFLEINLKGAEPILCEYVDESNWTRILKLLDGNL
jgi:hypothetical protein